MIRSSWFYPNSRGNSEFILPLCGEIALTCQNSYFCHFSPYVLLVDYTFDIFIAACQDGNIKLTCFFSLHVVERTCQRGFFLLFSQLHFKKKKVLCKFSTSLTGVTNTRIIPKGYIATRVFALARMVQLVSLPEKKIKKICESNTRITKPKRLRPAVIFLHQGRHIFAIFSQLRPNILHHTSAQGLASRRQRRQIHHAHPQRGGIRSERQPRMAFRQEPRKPLIRTGSHVCKK